jgi:hypothetical protein
LQSFTRAKTSLAQAGQERHNGPLAGLSACNPRRQVLREPLHPQAMQIDADDLVLQLSASGDGSALTVLWRIAAAYSSDQ